MPRARKRFTAYVVPETHWDRAWYIPFEQFRVRLVRMTEHLLRLLERKPNYRRFSFDGQTVVLEDVLAIRPDLEPLIRKYVQNRRIAIGPWYVLPDEFLVSGEALVRNLLIGLRVARQFGPVMEAGYIPDPFGHVSQLPQILSGFNIDSVIFSRGLGDDGDRLGLEFRWIAPDGESSVIAVHQCNGYGNVSAWGAIWGVPLEDEKIDFDKAHKRAVDLIAKMEQMRPATHCLLFNNGADHLPAQPLIPELIDYLNARIDNTHFVQADFQEFVEAVRRAKPRLKSYSGEMHDGKYHHILSGVFSARMYLKQQNELCQRHLEGTTEPLAVLAAREGLPYHSHFLTYAWKELIKNHPHDDICGCSVDAVHRDMVNRFAHVQQVADSLDSIALDKITPKINTAAGPAGIPMLVFNPAPWTRNDVIRLKTTIPADQLPGETAKVVDGRGRRMGAELTISKPRDEAYWDFHKFSTRPVREVEVAFLAEDLPSVGFKTFYLQPADTPESKPRVRVTKNSIENEFVRVVVEKSGALTITNKETKIAIRGANTFEDMEDLGDEYDYSPLPPAASQAFTSDKQGRVKSVRMIEDAGAWAAIQIDIDFQVPKSLTPDREARSKSRVVIPIQSIVRLHAGSRRVEFTTTIDNRARDHRIRALFPTPIITDTVHAGSKFDVVTRPVVQPKGEGWVQPPVPTQHVDRFVSIDNGRAGVTVINRGLPEYETRHAGKNVTICQTLFRSTGWLSTGKLVTRNCNAGPELEAPEAQCLGPNTYEYAVVIHRHGWERARTYVDALLHGTPTVARIVGRHDGPRPNEFAFLRIAPDSLVLSALKKAEEGDDLIVRFYNIATKAVKGTVEFRDPIARAALANLDEKPIRKLGVQRGNRVALRVKPKSIITLRVKLRG